MEEQQMWKDQELLAAVDQLVMMELNNINNFSLYLFVDSRSSE
jgi:hypothetical protein